MQLQAKQPTVKAPADTFTGDAWYDTLVRGEEPSRIRVAVVRFAPGARNAWHAHAVGQTVHVTEGIGLIQSRGENVVEIHPGDTVVTPAGEWHWHGAAPDRFMTHLAMWEAPAEGQETEWGELVSDAEYLGKQSGSTWSKEGSA
jgi:quercetin dioxygenase-like cupin family protein